MCEMRAMGFYITPPIQRREQQQQQGASNDSKLYLAREELHSCRGRPMGAMIITAGLCVCVLVFCGASCGGTSYRVQGRVRCGGLGGCVCGR